MHLINFFDENPSAVIQDAVENLTKSFEGLEIKKSRVAEFMKEDCNLSIKVVTRHPKDRNSVVQEVGYSVLLGAVSTFGVVNVSMRELGNVKKKRKAPEDAVAAAIPKGTTAGLFCAIH
ncbi:hypothetical protein G6F60_013832 [Rhizopus arrhizus]|nr:hypothetical protein G6F23_013956 [Rhizopus arrhizus]KAG1388154.1 hypothetical protein G6F60_013832 [Rhizopus arrhizus]